MQVPAHQRYTLDNGTRVLLLPDDRAPTVSFQARLRGGAVLDAHYRSGAASLLAELTLRGAGPRDEPAFSEAVEEVGGLLDAETRAEATVWRGAFLARDADRLLTLLADALQRPHLTDAQFDEVRARRLVHLRALKATSPQSLIGAYGRALLWRAHPLALPAHGSESGLSGLEAAAVRELYRVHYGADRLLLAFAGALPRGFEARITETMGGWSRASAALAPLPPAARRRGRHALLIDVPAARQCYLWFGNASVAADYELRVALQVLNTALGGRFGSLLMQSLRVEQGLSYDAHSQITCASATGEFAIETAVEVEACGRALDLVGAVIERVREGLVEPALGEAQGYLLGNYMLGFETSADRIGALIALEQYGLPVADIEQFETAVRATDTAATRRAACEALPPASDLVIVAMGDATMLRPQLESRVDSLREKSLRSREFTVRR